MSIELKDHNELIDRSFTIAAVGKNYLHLREIGTAEPIDVLATIRDNIPCLFITHGAMTTHNQLPRLPLNG